MARNGTGITRETCRAEDQTSTTAASLATGESESSAAGVGAADSSVDLWDMITPGERSGSAYIQATRRSKGSGDGRAKARIRTPAKKVRKLQIALYRKAKAEPQWRFYSLYGEIYRMEMLRMALKEVKANRGAGGVDGVRPEAIQEMEGGEQTSIS